MGTCAASPRLLPSMALAVKAQNAAHRRKIHSARLGDRRVMVHACVSMPSKSAAEAAEGVIPITSWDWAALGARSLGS